MRLPSHNLSARVISAIYVAIAALWIVIADKLLAPSGDSAFWAALHHYEDWGFVAVTAILLYALLSTRDELKRTYEAEHKTAHKINLYAALCATNLAVMRATGRNVLFEEVCRVAVEHGGFKLAWIGMVDEAERAIRIVARGGSDEGYLDGLRLSTDPARVEGRGTSGTAVREGRQVVCNDLGADAAMLPWRAAALKAGFHAVASFPLWQEGRAVGVMSLYPTEKDFFDRALVDLLSEMARDISFALDNFQREEQRRRAEEALRAREQQLEILAHFDALTGLPNRALLQDRVEQALAFAARNSRRLALLYIDLDRFKNINDSLGHSVGDALLQAVAGRFSACVREEDTVSRLGGDEFLVVLPDANIEGAAQVARKIMISATMPYLAGGHELIVTPSIGISMFPEDGATFDALFKNADAAMYHAKANGRNNYQFFTAHMTARARERLSLENGLRRALEREEFVLHYQPQVAMGSGTFIGVEALIRWRHPELGLVEPEKFIPIAEDSGLIAPIGEWVMDAACRQNRLWQQQGFAPFPVAVNLSALQFRQKNLPEKIEALLRRSGLPARYLELELTEGVVMQHAEETVVMLDRLKATGLQLAIDDFGTGYSSLSYLKRFPLDRLKIGRAFIRDLASDPDDAAIVRAVISMAGSLRLKVIAEGVETQEQMAFLEAERCDEIQGYYFSRPLPVPELTALLGKWTAQESGCAQPAA